MDGGPGLSVDDIDGAEWYSSSANGHSTATNGRSICAPNEKGDSIMEPPLSFYR